MADFGVNYSFDGKQAKPLDEYPESYSHDGTNVSHPEQSPEGEEYLCGNSGREHSYANPGRDQDRSRADERVAAQGCARYVS